MKIPSEAELIEMGQRFAWMAEYDYRHTEDFERLIAIVREYVQTRTEIEALRAEIEAYVEEFGVRLGPVQNAR
jgi:hypothetical protein